MYERKGDLFEAMYDGPPVNAVCITTNGFVKKNGEAVMGAGIAKQFKEEFPEFPFLLGTRLRFSGNQPYVFRYMFIEEDICTVTLPVKHHWREKADLTLIDRSIKQLRFLADAHAWERVYLPRPGCGNGQRHWGDVKPILDRQLDQRFTVFHL